jgi:hypothetical protein
MAEDERIKVADLANKACTMLEICIISVLLVFNCISSFENRKGINLKQPQKRWRISLLLSCTFSFLSCALNVATVWYPWQPGEDVSCQWLFHISSMFYFIEKQFLYLFLYDRAKIVHLNMTLGPRQDRWMMYLRWMMFLTLTIGIPVSFYWSAFVALTGSLNILPGDCIFFNVYPQVPVAFAVSDLALAGGMTLMFLIPLLRQRRRIRMLSLKTESLGPLDKMIITNARFSFIAIASGLLSLIGFATCNYIASQDPSLTYLRGWGGFSVSCDIVLAVIA